MPSRDVSGVKYKPSIGLRHIVISFAGVSQPRFVFPHKVSPHCALGVVWHSSKIGSHVEGGLRDRHGDASAVYRSINSRHLVEGLGVRCSGTYCGGTQHNSEEDEDPRTSRVGALSCSGKPCLKGGMPW